MESNNILSKIQTELKAPKNQFNGFGGYNYRSCEDILNALKPLLTTYSAALILYDEIVMVGERYYVKAVARLQQGDKLICETTSFAREAESRKGMDDSQITGSASSYARKYALNGLFAIDDTKDADATNKHEDNEKPKKAPPKQTKQSTKKGNEGEGMGEKEKKEFIWSFIPELGSDLFDEVLSKLEITRKDIESKDFPKEIGRELYLELSNEKDRVERIGGEINGT